MFRKGPEKHRLGGEKFHAEGDSRERQDLLKEKKEKEEKDAKEKNDTSPKLTVRKFMFEGIPYIASKSTGIAYDYDEWVNNNIQKQIGMYNFETKLLKFNESDEESEEEEDEESEEEEDEENYEENYE